MESKVSNRYPHQIENTKSSLTYTKRIKKDSIDRLKENLFIAEVVSQHLTLKGNKACCPFHDEKTASFHINPAKNIFKCFGCGKGGNSIDFIMEYLKKDFISTIEYLAAKNHFQLEYEESFDAEKYQVEKDKIESLREIVQFAQTLYENELNDLSKGYNAREYLKDRSFSNDAIKEWGLGYAPDSRFITPKLIEHGKFNDAIEAGVSCINNGKNFDFLYGRITIPILNTNGKIVGIAGRQIDNKTPKYLNPKESELYKKSDILFGLSQAINAKAFTKKESGNPYVYVVEGYFDVISLHEAGCLNTVAACGTAISENQVKLLSRFTKHTIIFFDSDKPGIAKSLKLIDQLLKQEFKVEIIVLPGEMDPDEYAKDFIKNNPGESFSEHLFSLHQDAVLWKAGKLIDSAIDPDDRAIAIEELTKTMLTIPNDIKRNSYIERIQREKKIKYSALKNEVKKAIEKREKEATQKHEKAMFEGKEISNEDAGLPKDYIGDIKTALKYGVFEHNGIYWAKVKQAAYAISNFKMKILFHVSSARDVAYKIISATNEWGFETVFQINTDDWITLSGFKKTLARKPNFVFKGTDSDLTKLQQFLQESQVESQIIETLGFSKRGNFYAFANGIIPLNNDEESGTKILKTDKYGIVEYKKKHYYLPALSKIHDDKDELFLIEKKFVFIEPTNKIPFNKWAEIFTNTYGKKGMVAIVWLIASFFRDVIMSAQGSFPILNMYGQRGSGKGYMINSIMRLFGDPQEQIMLGGESTGKGFMRKFAQFSNAVVWGDEYKNNLPPKIIENLKNIFDGTGYTRAKMTNDFQTDITPVRSSLILSGQEMPTVEPALFTRVIMLQFEPGKFTDIQKKNSQLLKSIEFEGLSYLTTEILRHRQLFINGYKMKYKEIDDQLAKEINNKEVDERFIKNISTIATTYALLKDAVDFPFTYKELTTYLKDNMMEQFKILSGSDDLGKWWQTVEFLAHIGSISEGKDYLLEAGDHLLIRLKTVHPLYLKELRSQGSVGLDMATLLNYIQKDSRYVGKTKKTFPNANNMYTQCYKIKYSLLDIDLFKTEVTFSEQKRLLREEYDSNRITTEEFLLRSKEIDKDMDAAKTPVEEKRNSDYFPFPIG